MKKIINVLIAGFIAITIFPFSVSAQELTSNDNQLAIHETEAKQHNSQRGVVYCDRYRDGIHRMHTVANVTVLSLTGNIRYTWWGGYECECSHTIIAAGHPDIGGVIGNYFADKEIYGLGNGFGNIVTDDTPSYSSEARWDGYL